MKPFNAGQLLDAKKSPFHQALTPAQSDVLFLLTKCAEWQ